MVGAVGTVDCLPGGSLEVQAALLAVLTALANLITLYAARQARQARETASENRAMLAAHENGKHGDQ